MKVDDITTVGYRLLADIRDYDQLRVAHGSDRERPLQMPGPGDQGRCYVAPNPSHNSGAR